MFDLVYAVYSETENSYLFYLNSQEIRSNAIQNVCQTGYFYWRFKLRSQRQLN